MARQTHEENIVDGAEDRSAQIVQRKKAIRIVSCLWCRYGRGMIRSPARVEVDRVARTDQPTLSNLPAWRLPALVFKKISHQLHLSFLRVAYNQPDPILESREVFSYCIQGLSQIKAPNCIRHVNKSDVTKYHEQDAYGTAVVSTPYHTLGSSLKLLLSLSCSHSKWY